MPVWNQFLKFDKQYCLWVILSVGRSGSNAVRSYLFYAMLLGLYYINLKRIIAIHFNPIKYNYYEEVIREGCQELVV